MKISTFYLVIPPPCITFARIDYIKNACIMKKFIIAFVFLFFTVASSFAQFEKGKMYIGTSFDGLGVSYNGSSHFAFGLGANAGYMVKNNWLVLGNLGVDTYWKYAQVKVGVAGRYYFEQNGIYLQAAAKYEYYKGSCGTVALGPEIGYCHYLNGHLTIEPAIYADFSLNDFSKHTTVGLKIGLGWYF